MSGSDTRRRPSACSRRIATNAPSRSPAARTSTNWSATPNFAAASPRSLTTASKNGPDPNDGFSRTATREIPGASSFGSWSRLATTSGPTSKVSPVTFPPGRARLLISLSSTGLVASVVTIGIVALTLSSVVLSDYRDPS